jgi:hypothetical protein
MQDPGFSFRFEVDQVNMDWRLYILRFLAILEIPTGDPTCKSIVGLLGFKWCHLVFNVIIIN